MANFGMVGLDWQERVNWDRLRNYRLDRARERMKAHGLGAMLLMYDENVRYVTSTLTPGWNRLKPGLRYALLCGDDPPVLFRWRGALHRIRASSGPERIAAEWWRGGAPSPDREQADMVRDYYRVEDTAGARYWLFRTGRNAGAAGTRWFLHGVFG